MSMQIGDRVEWKSMGRANDIRNGVIALIIPKRVNPVQWMQRYGMNSSRLRWGQGADREHESYIVESEGYFYWPRVSALRPVSPMRSDVSEPKRQLRVWHIPQVPGKPFHVSVSSPEEAMTIIDVLARYDQFQYEHRIKPDYSNASGLEVYEACVPYGDEVLDDKPIGEWVEWHDDEDRDVMDLLWERNNNKENA